MKYILTFFCGCFLIVKAYPQTNFLKLASPKSDSINTSSSKIYITGLANTSGKLFVNGSEVKVYSTGAFAASADLALGRNVVPIKLAINKDTIRKDLIVNYILPTPAKPTMGFAIDYAKVIPSQDQWLSIGERLEVEVKATPGKQVTFLKNIKLEEVNPLFPETSGIYRGEYLIKPGDTLINRAINFKLTDPFTGKSITTGSKQKISFISDEKTIIGITTGERPYLNYGLGEDRLGGAKVGYIDTMIRLEVIGKTGNMYRVKLSDEMDAYIPVENLRILPGINFKPQSLTGSWSVSGDGKYDYVSVGLNQRLPYSTVQEINPSRIVVDVYGAISNTNWITQKEGLSAIKNVWYNQISKDVFRVFIELKDPTFWGYDVFYRGNSLTIKVKSKPKNLELSKLVIGIDAGHGGSNTGAEGLTGAKEKDITLSIAKKLNDILQTAGATTYITRKNDTSFNSSDRLLWMKRRNPDLLVSIHCNSSSNPLVEGTSTYYKHIGLRPLSQFVYKEMLTLGLKDFGNIGNFNFFFNAPTEYPSVLVETGFISNPADEERLLNPLFQASIAQKIANGITNFLEYNGLKNIDVVLAAPASAEIPPAKRNRRSGKK